MMKITLASDGTNSLDGMTDKELRSLLKMIKGACLEERRVFDRVKKQIEGILKTKEL